VGGGPDDVVVAEVGATVVVAVTRGAMGSISKVSGVDDGSNESTPSVVDVGDCATATRTFPLALASSEGRSATTIPSAQVTAVSPCRRRRAVITRPSG